MDSPAASNGKHIEEAVVSRYGDGVAFGRHQSTRVTDGYDARPQTGTTPSKCTPLCNCHWQGIDWDTAIECKFSGALQWVACNKEGLANTAAFRVSSNMPPSSRV